MALAHGALREILARGVVAFAVMAGLFVAVMARRPRCGRACRLACALRRSSGHAPSAPARDNAGTGAAARLRSAALAEEAPTPAQALPAAPAQPGRPARSAARPAKAPQGPPQSATISAARLTDPSSSRRLLAADHRGRINPLRRPCTAASASFSRTDAHPVPSTGVAKARGPQPSLRKARHRAARADASNGRPIQPDAARQTTALHRNRTPFLPLGPSVTVT